VEILNLSSNELRSRKMANVLFLLTMMVVPDLSHNSLTGTPSREIWTWWRLEELYLQGDDLGWTLPPPNVPFPPDSSSSTCPATGSRDPCPQILAKTPLI